MASTSTDLSSSRADETVSGAGEAVRHRGAGRLLPVLLAAGLVLGWLSGAAPGAPPVADVPPTAQVPTPVAGDVEGAYSVLQARSLPRRPRPGVPHRLEVRRLGVAAPVLPISVENGVLTPPSDPTSVGWWRDGAKPGGRRGTAVLTGHTVHTGGGALDELGRLEPRDVVEIGTDHGPLRYRVTSVQTLGKELLAARSAAIFDQEGRGRLVLITCSDWDGQGYRSNVVVTARPAG